MLAGAAVAADAGALALAIIAGIVGAGLLGDGVLALRRAGRSRVGAVSEARVRRALDPLRAEGWRVAHGVRWRVGGDIDHVVCSPNGLGFAIETKTRRYSRAQLAAHGGDRALAGPSPTAVPARRAAGAVRGLRPPCPGDRARVRIVSLDGLLDALRAAAVESPTSAREWRLRRRACGGRAAARS